MSLADGREVWGTRIGLILAMAGNAVGLGNFLRFPVQAAKNGGGAFMIPYFISLILLGIPLMWMEWAIGRMGGRYGHGTTPGMFTRLWNHPLAPYLGALGIFLPLVIAIYYTYIESWTLAFSFFSLTHKYFGITTRAEMDLFLRGFQGVTEGPYFNGIWMAYGFFLLCVGINVYILSCGVVKGIERLAKVAMPALFLFALILVVRIFTLGTPDPAIPERSVFNGLLFLYTPDFSVLGKGSVWLAAAGQIFFTLSLATGCIHTYASYLREKEDVLLSGLTTASLNEMAEVVLGASIAIPVAVAFFGVRETQEIASSGAFDLGFQAMPIIFQGLPAGGLLGCLWFFLLFLAALTSSIALLQPAMAFLQDELKLTRERAAKLVGALVFVCCQPVIFLLGGRFLDEMDFWAGTVGLALFGAVEAVLFSFLFGMKRGWEEMHLGAEIKLPKVFFFVMKYVTPLFLMVILFSWLYQDGLSVLAMKGASPEVILPRWAARVMMGLLLSGLLFLVFLARKMEETKNA